MNGRGVGVTQDFVLAQGFQDVGGYAAPVARDGSRRLLAELFADPDRPEARPQEAYLELLASLAPGWTVRLLQVTWPDPEPRQAFLGGMESWGASDPADHGGQAGQDGRQRWARRCAWGCGCFSRDSPSTFGGARCLSSSCRPGRRPWAGGVVRRGAGAARPGARPARAGGYPGSGPPPAGSGAGLKGGIDGRSRSA